MHKFHADDCLNNGANGKVLEFVKTDGKVTHVIVKFENEDTGNTLREVYTN